MPLGIAAVILARVTATTSVPLLEDPVALSGGAALLLGPPLYLLARSRRPERAAWATVLVTNLTVWASLLSTQGTAFQASTPYFLGLGPILATAFLPIGATAALVSLNTIGLLLLAHLSRHYSWFEAVNPLIFLAILSGFVLVVSTMRHNDLRKIEQQHDRLAESEDRLRQLFDSAYEGIVLHDKGRILIANGAAARLLGVDDPALLVGRHALEFAGPSDQPRIAEAIRSGDTSPYTVIKETPDGTRHYIELQGKPIRYDGQDVRFTALRDVTARHRIEQARRRAHEQETEIRRLKEVSAYKTQIFNMAAHELNTPLTPIRMQLHILRHTLQGDPDPRKQKAVEVVDRNIQRLAALVQDFLDVARIEHGILRLDTAAVDLDDLTAECIDSFQPQARRNGIRLHQRTVREPGAPEVTIGDPKRLTEVLYNLVANALRFTTEEGTVTVTVHKTQDAVAVDVTDTGVGMTEDDMERLFKPFASLTEGTTGQGTGLGLYICKGFVEAHGGTIRCGSPGPGKGATFTFELPVQTQDDEGHPDVVATLPETER